MDLDDFFSTLEIVYKTKLYNRESLIILDEVQLFPEARQALKTLLIDKRYDYIETGSLAGIIQKSRSKNILIPSEEEELEMFPFDFEEFLWALGDYETINVIREHKEKSYQFGQALFRTIMNKFRNYMVVGGMPQAVIKYITTKDFEEVDFVKKSIINLYRNDMKEQKDVNNFF